MRNLLLAAVVFILTLSAAELVFHLLVRPSVSSAGNLFGIELPPYRVVLDGGSEKNLNDQVWHPGFRNPRNLTVGDIQGMIREDAILGYTTPENTNSKMGWSHSNNLGANTSAPTLAAVPAGKKRVLIFGDSFGRGCGLPQTETWSEQWQLERSDLNLVNFAVGGYSMGQALKRFELLRQKIDYDTVAFVFVPDTDIWRDINTMRYLAEGWWAFAIEPRYKLIDGKLTWVPGPYAIPSEIYQHDVEELTPRVRDHLRANDAFYFPLLYEKPPWLGKLITYKLLAHVLGEAQRQKLLESQMRLDGEGMLVERQIFISALQMAQSQGKRFVLIFLPSPKVLDAIKHDASAPAQREWDAVVQSFAAAGLPLIDLLPGMLKETEATDRSFDYMHYGPKTNQLVSRVVEMEFSSRGM